jgi:hypothetical protein
MAVAPENKRVTITLDAATHELLDKASTAHVCSLSHMIHALLVAALEAQVKPNFTAAWWRRQDHQPRSRGRSARRRLRDRQK